MEELRIEHYKALKEEQRQYLFHVQQLWIFKFSTLGAVIAAAIFNGKINDIGPTSATRIIAMGILAIPFLSLLIDLKVVEVAYHVKLISNHLKNKFTDVEEIRDWEINLWSKNEISAARTNLTILASLGVSLCVLVVSFFAVDLLVPDWRPILILVFIGVVILTAVGSILAISKLTRSHT